VNKKYPNKKDVVKVTLKKLIGFPNKNAKLMPELHIKEKKEERERERDIYSGETFSG